uniref:Uncharacterized protein n=1 Tax=Spumella elongata TaxID=89044 RepID=A0A7S3HI40_9STRA|mmetsp:Transcript_53716/g.93710  ORF Transcript_53716/g.93710 Transcript_53716/m.93710 type:complete len:106 (+) Transcript_53716:3-320(+)
MVDDDVVQAAGDLLLGCGLVDQPVVSKRLAILLGLENHPHLQCATRLGEDDPEEAAARYAGPNRPPPPRFGAGVLAGPGHRRADEEAARSSSPAPQRRMKWRDES